MKLALALVFIWDRMKKNKYTSSLVLLSGGLDSATCLYYAFQNSEKVYAISFDYSQRHKIELKKAKLLAKKLLIDHTIVKLQTGLFQNSSLTNKSILVPKNFNSKEKIPNTYVPGRNILFLSYATSFAESRNIENIFIGVNILDYSGYPDCRPEFIEAFQKMISIGTKSGEENKTIKIRMPLIKLTKKEIIIFGNKLGVPFSLTHSCYDPIQGKACHKCDACLLRSKGFAEAKLQDML
jgi:7-cyano-7-deazaguanine synthase